MTPATNTHRTLQHINVGEEIKNQEDVTGTLIEHALRKSGPNNTLEM